MNRGREAWRKNVTNCPSCIVVRYLQTDFTLMEIEIPFMNLESAVMMFSPSELEEELLDSKTDLSAMVLTKVP